MLLQREGNYLNVFVKNETTSRGVFVYVNEEFQKQLDALIEGNNCDLTSITWPRRADGSSDYDNKIIRTHQKELLSGIAATYAGFPDSQLISLKSFSNLHREY